MPTVKETFEAMPETFQKDKALDVVAVYQFDISGDGGGKWYAEVNKGELNVAEGEHENPSITISMLDQDYLDMASGKLHGQTAFMTGRLKIKGDMALAIQMNKIFKRKE